MQLYYLEVKLTTEVLSVLHSKIPGIFAISSFIFLAAVKMFLVFSMNPSLPCFISAAQVPATTAPDLLPA